MRTGTLDAETILATTEDVLRRHGPAKATVVDVARALGVSHGTVYRHFPSKAALREAVTRRWINRSHEELASAAADTTLDPGARLRRWLDALFAAKRAKASEDPELQATYRQLVTDEHSPVVAEHIADLVGQVRDIIADGIATGDFATLDPGVAARAVFNATARFHDPAHATEWYAPGIDAEFDAVCALVLNGLGAR